MSALRTSPLADCLADPEQTVRVHEMEVPLRVTARDGELARTLGIADASALPRFGVKGPRAADWLRGRGVPVPAEPNTWAALRGGLIARLGRGEFWVEEGFSGGPVADLRSALPRPEAGLHPVPRQDAALVLAGARVHELLAQTCSVNFRALDLAAHSVALTMVAGVALAAIPSERDGLPLVRIWCDGTWGPYLFDTLAGIARELGGGPVGLECLFPEAAGHGTL